MTIQRRDILRSLLAAPFVVTTPGLLMPVRAERIYWDIDDEGSPGPWYIPTYEELRGVTTITYVRRNVLQIPQDVKHINGRIQILYPGETITFVGEYQPWTH